MLRFLSSPLRWRFAGTGGCSFGSDNGPVSWRTRLWPPAHTTMMATSNFVLPSFVSATENFFSGDVLLTGLCELMSPCSLLRLRKKPFSLSPTYAAVTTNDDTASLTITVNDLSNDDYCFSSGDLRLAGDEPKQRKKNIFSLADQQFR